MTSSRVRELYMTMKYCLLLTMLFANDLSRIQASSAIVELTDHTFGDYSKSRDFLMVNFYAPWCSDSKALAPELEKTAYSLGRRSTDIVKVDCFGKGKRLCEIYGIKHWPTLKTFRHGILNTEYQGSHHAESILNYINGAEDMISGSTSSGIVPNSVGPVLETALNNNNNNNNNNIENNNNNSENSVTKSSSCESGLSNSKITSSSTTAATGPTATYEKPEIVPASSYATAGTSEVGTAVGGDQIVGTAGASAEDVVTITPQGNVQVGSPQTTGEKVASLAAAAALVTPPAEVINQLECAKCKIMTPVQRSQSASCRQYKRSCIPQRLSDPADKLSAIKAAAAAKERYDIDKRQRLYF